MNAGGRILLALSLGVAALGGTSCRKVEAKTPGPTSVPLVVPEPPARVPLPVSAEPPPQPAATTEKPPVTNPPAARPPRPSPTPTPAPPPASTGTTTGDTAPPPAVQTPGQADLEARAKERLIAADRDLQRVNARSLGREAQAQFDSAKRFVRLAREALTARNYVYAASCAEKAATLAALLVKG